MFANFTLEIKLHLVHIRADLREFVSIGPVFPDEKQLSHLHLGTDLLQAFPRQRIRQGFTPILPSAGQDGVSSILVALDDHQQSSIPNDDGFG